MARPEQLVELEGMGFPLPSPGQGEEMRQYLGDANDTNNKISRGRKSFTLMAEIGIEIASRYDITDYELLKAPEYSKKVNTHHPSRSAWYRYSLLHFPR